MAQYQYVLPSVTVSRELFEELNRICANDYLEEKRSFFISVLNKRLSGHDPKAVSEHLDVLTKYGDEQSIRVADMVKDWLKRYHAQRSLIHVPYDSPVLTDSTRIENKPGLLREVTQDMYDAAVINVFRRTFSETRNSSRSTSIVCLTALTSAVPGSKTARLPFVAYPASILKTPAFMTRSITPHCWKTARLSTHALRTPISAIARSTTPFSGKHG